MRPSGRPSADVVSRGIDVLADPAGDHAKIIVVAGAR
jgi:hypothetical protein